MFKLAWLLALPGDSCSSPGVEESRLLKRGIRDSCGDGGDSFGVLGKDAFAPANEI